MTRRVLISLPAKARDLETALHAACDSGHWDGEVRLVFGNDASQCRIELVTEG